VIYKMSNGQQYTIQQFDRANRFLKNCENDFVTEVKNKNRLIRSYMLVPTRASVAQLFAVQDSLRAENDKLKLRLKKIARAASV
jgi:ABC-type proline/glycine betaine transport system ATPase subunit